MFTPKSPRGGKNIVGLTFVENVKSTTCPAQQTPRTGCVTVLTPVTLYACCGGAKATALLKRLGRRSVARRRATERRWAYISSVSGAALLAAKPLFAVPRISHSPHIPPIHLALICSKACCCSYCMRADVLSTIVRWPPHTNCGLRDRQSP